MRELCRRLCIQFGVSSMSGPLIDLGAALTRAQCVAADLAHEVDDIYPFNCMTPSTHLKGIISITQEHGLQTWEQIVKECQIALACLGDALWSRSWYDDLQEDDAADVHKNLLDVHSMLQDVEGYLNLMINTFKINVSSEFQACERLMSDNDEE